MMINDSKVDGDKGETLVEDISIKYYYLILDSPIIYCNQSQLVHEPNQHFKFPNLLPWVEPH